MENKNTGLALQPKALEMAKKMDSIIHWAGTEIQQMAGLERTYSLAQAMTMLRETLTPEYMIPIMALQGTKLGFKTDSKEPKGYSEAVVKECLIEATLNGLEVVGNQWNIIKGQMYITKEGLAYKLNNIPGLAYQLIPALPRMNAQSTSAAVEMKIIWSMHDGPKKEITLPIPIKMDQYTTTDAVLGKATRKARAWLFATVTGRELPDGDSTDMGDVKEKPISKSLADIGEDTKFEDMPKQTEVEVETKKAEPGQEVVTPEIAKTTTRTTSIKDTGLFDSAAASGAKK